MCMKSYLPAFSIGKQREAHRRYELDVHFPTPLPLKGLFAKKCTVDSYINDSFGRLLVVR